MKFLHKVITVALSMTLTLTVVSGCNRGTKVENVDTTKTQIYVGFYDSGVSKVWIQNAKTAFENKYANTVFQKGKKGVQVILDLDKAGLNGGSLLNTIGSKRDQIFFIENSDMYEFVNRGYVKEITSLVKSPAVAEETNTIESKLNVNSAEYYNINGKYYAMPYYEAFIGLNYNIDLFDKQNYYFALGANTDEFDWLEGNMNDLFIQNKDDAKAYGPDGRANTSDDGLPATYNDFRALLMRISSYGDLPFIWCGNYLTYLVEFLNAVWADYEGYDQMNLNWSMNGTATDLINVDAKGNITEIGDTAIKDGDVGYLLQKQAGKYHALEFAKMCVSNSDYYYADSFKNAIDHLNAQKRFVKAGTGNYENIAMLIDGNWWDTEATSNFDSNPTSTNSKLNRNFGLMPIPKADSSKIGEERTLITLNNSMTFINSNTSDDVLEAVETFFKYIHSDEAMNIFSEVCNMMRPFNYTLTESTLSKMSTYGKEMYRIHSEAAKYASGDKTVYPIRIQDTFPTSAAAINNTTLLNPKTWGWSNNEAKVNPFVTFKENADLSAASYFNSMYDLYSTSWSAKWH